jgi:hypothetical protein
VSCLIYFRGVKPEVECHVNGINLRFLCASYRSLYQLSSLSLVRLCDVLFLVTAKIIPTSSRKSYLLQSYCTHHFQNPYIFASYIALRIMQGLNLTHLVFIVCSKMKSHMKTRFVPKMNALSLSSFNNTILDIGIISSLSSLGLLGVKLGTIS